MANITTDSPTATSSDATGFVYGPNTRGTFDIVYGCVLVLITAIWTVLHTNIPAHGDSSWSVLKRRLRWGCVSIFAPDVLTLVAAAQWTSARKSTTEMRTSTALLRERPERWAMEHSFYADSGGFMLQCPDSRPFPINAASTHYLVTKGYIELPDMSTAEIWDKSKADVFAKATAILQGLWLLVQSIARTAQGLPSSPLELFTLAFVVSTAMSYFFWWRKPQNVSTPTLIICNYGVALIRADAGLPSGGWERTPMDWIEQGGQAWVRRDMFKHFDLETGPSNLPRTSLVRMCTEEFKRQDLGKTPVDLGRKDSELTLLKLASSTTSKLEARSHAAAMQSEQQPAQRIPDDAYLPARLEPKVLLSLVIPSMVHSCIHLLGWNLDYPTTIEKQLWRAAAVTLIAMSCVAVGAVRLLAIIGYKGRHSLLSFWVNANWETTGALEPKGNSKGSQREIRNKWLGEITFWEITLSFATAALVLARLFIIVEVIISLRSLPKGVYVTVNWVDFIPHV
ncbi:unnamed protein product [Discula destructiva]